MKHRLSWLILIAFFLLVEWLWGWALILKPWATLSIDQVLLGLLLLFVSYIIRAFRLYDYFSTETRWIPVFRLMLIHNFLNNILPARLGEISFPVLMKRYFAISYLRSSPALLWFRLLDLHAMLMLAVAIWLVNQQFSFIADILFLLALGTPLVIFWFKSPVQRHIENWNNKPATGKRLKKAGHFMAEAMHGLPANYFQLFKSLLLTWLNWLVKLLVLAWFIGLFAPLELQFLVTAAVAGELTSILPFHAPGGFGTYEAGLMSVLLPLLEPGVAAAAAVNTHLFLLGSSALGFAVASLIPEPASTT